MAFAGLFNQKRILLGRHGLLSWRRLELSPAAARMHMHVMGVSGSGKSRFLAWLALELQRIGLPFVLLDPHGDMGKLVLAELVRRGTYGTRFRPDHPQFTRLLYLDIPAAAHRDMFLPFNVLRQPGTAHDISENVLKAFERVWPALGNGAAPRFAKLVLHGVKLLLSGGLPLVWLEEVLNPTDSTLRTALLAREHDPTVVRFWSGWYDRLTTKQRFEYSESTSSRLMLLNFNPILRHSLGHRQNTFDVRQMMDSGTSVILNVHIPGEHAQRLFGCLFTVLAETGAMSRGDIDPSQRKRTTHLIMDEATLFTAQSSEGLKRILSEARKFGLFLVFGHQNYSQADEHLRGAMQNVGMEVLFAQGEEDAQQSAGIMTHLDTRTIRRRAQEAETDESIGMREQLEDARQALRGQWQGDAYIGIHSMQRPPWWKRLLLHPRPLKTRKVRIPYLPDPEVNRQLLANIEAHYLSLYFEQPDVSFDDTIRELKQGNETTRWE